MYIYLEVVSLDGWSVCRLTLNNNRSKILKCVCFVPFCYMSHVCDATNHPDTDKCVQMACVLFLRVLILHHHQCEINKAGITSYNTDYC